MIVVRPYVDRLERNFFERWYLKLDESMQYRVLRVLERVELGNFSDSKSVGAGVLRFDCTLVRDIEFISPRMEMLSFSCYAVVQKSGNKWTSRAHALWQEYLVRKEKKS